MNKKAIFNPSRRPANASAGATPQRPADGIILSPQRLCETRGGDLAFSLGRLRFRRGRSMLVEHLDGLFLEHALCGRVLTGGYGEEFDIMHIFAEEA